MNKSTFEDLLPKTLYESIKTKSCGFFVGAGVSNLKPTNLPSWGDLLKQFLKYAKSNQKLGEEILYELDNALALRQYLEIAEFLQGILKEDYIRFLRSIFDNDILNINRNHELLASLECPLIITTNYDKLLENAMIVKGHNPISSTAINVDLLEQIHKISPRKKILKIHGDINNSDSLVLSETDYLKIQNNNMLNTVLRSFFHRMSFVFIGCSMKDPDVLIFLKQIRSIFKGFTPTHYALIRKSEVSEIDKYIYKNIYNIEFLLIDDFEEVTQFLELSLELQKEQNHSNIQELILNEHSPLNYLEFCLDQFEYYYDIEIEDYHFDSEIDYKNIDLDDDIKMYQFISNVLEDFKSMELNKLPLFPQDDLINVDKYIKSTIDNVISLPKARKKQLEVLCNEINEANDYLGFFIKKLKGYIRLRRVHLSNEINPTDINRLMLENYQNNYFKL